MTATTVRDHTWYKELRRKYPSDDECWEWDGNMQVGSGAFWRAAGGSAKVSVRPYLVVGIVGDGKPASYEPGWSAGPTCERNCVNPYHAVRAEAGRPAEPGSGMGLSGRTGDLVLHSTFDWGYLHALISGVWYSTCVPLAGRVNKDIKAAKRSVSERFPIIPEHWRKVESVCGMMAVQGKPLIYRDVIEACGWDVAEGTMPEALVQQYMDRVPPPAYDDEDDDEDDASLPHDRAGALDSPPPVKAARTVRKRATSRTTQKARQ